MEISLFFSFRPVCYSVAALVEPLFENGPGHVNVPAQRLGGMAPQKEAVEHRCFALRRQRIEIIPGCHAQATHWRKASINATGA